MRVKAVPTIRPRNCHSLDKVAKEKQTFHGWLSDDEKILRRAMQGKQGKLRFSREPWMHSQCWGKGEALAWQPRSLSFFP